MSIKKEYKNAISEDAPDMFKLNHITVQEPKSYRRQGTKHIEMKQFINFDLKQSLVNPIQHDFFSKPVVPKLNFDNISKKIQTGFDEFSLMKPSLVNDFTSGKTGLTYRSQFYVNYQKQANLQGFKKQKGALTQFSKALQTPKRILFNTRIKSIQKNEQKLVENINN